MKRLFFITLAVLAASFMGGEPLLAQCGMGGHSGHGQTEPEKSPAPKNERAKPATQTTFSEWLAAPDFTAWTDNLDLSEAQKQKLSDIQYSCKQEMIQKNANLEKAQLELQQLLNQDQADLAQVKSKLHEMAKCEAEIAITTVSANVEARKLLTPEQLAMLQEMNSETTQDKMLDHQAHH